MHTSLYSNNTSLSWTRLILTPWCPLYYSASSTRQRGSMPYFDNAEYCGVWNFSGCTRISPFFFIRLFAPLNESKKYTPLELLRLYNSLSKLETCSERWFASNSVKYSCVRHLVWVLEYFFSICRLSLPLSPSIQFNL